MVNDSDIGTFTRVGNEEYQYRPSRHRGDTFCSVEKRCQTTLNDVIPLAQLE